MPPDIFSAANATPLMRAHLHGFTWLRDLRALGTDAARSRARALVSDFMDTHPLDPQANSPDVDRGAARRLAGALRFLRRLGR